MTWLWPITTGLVASTGALLGSGMILLLGRRAEQAASWLLSYAIGTLLGAAALGLLPEALARGAVERTMVLLLVGIVGFLVFEQALRERHFHDHHPHPDPRVERTTASMILWGDALHNLVDGMVIGVAFGVDTQFGLATVLAVLAHEVPQEIGDFAVLLEAGMPRRRAFFLNYLVALTTIPGVLVTYGWASASNEIIGWLLPIAAGGFFYIALSDLVPVLHHRRSFAAGGVQIVLVVAGVGTIWAMDLLHHG